MHGLDRQRQLALARGLYPALGVLALVTAAPAVFLVIASLTPLTPTRPESWFDFSGPAAQLPTGVRGRPLCPIGRRAAKTFRFHRRRAIGAGSRPGTAGQCPWSRTRVRPVGAHCPDGPAPHRGEFSGRSWTCRRPARSSACWKASGSASVRRSPIPIVRSPQLSSPKPGVVSLHADHVLRRAAHAPGPAGAVGACSMARMPANVPIRDVAIGCVKRLTVDAMFRLIDSATGFPADLCADRGGPGTVDRG